MKKDTLHMLVKMLNKLMSLCVILTLKCTTSDAILRTTRMSHNQNRTFSARQMGQTIAQCFGQDEVMHCLENKMLSSLDTAIQNNDTWRLCDFIVIEKKSHISPKDMEQLEKISSKQRSLSDSVAVKLLQLAQSRSLKLQLPTGVTALIDKGGISSGMVDDFNAATEDLILKDEGRKKKDKDKNMAMMGGMAMMAMVAQMFLGKVILIAGAAFVMAKIALMVSILGSLKKGSSGSSGSTEHVIVTGGGGGSSGGGGGGHSHEHSSGWHRSMPYQHSEMDAPINYYEISESEDEFKRRQTQI